MPEEDTIRCLAQCIDPSQVGASLSLRSRRVAPEFEKWLRTSSSSSICHVGEKKDVHKRTVTNHFELRVR